MASENLYNTSDVIQSYHWLGHQGHGYTELLAIHPDYKPGRENYEQNLKYKAFPKVRYAKNENQVLSFLSKYHGTHMCCYGVNPRPEILKGTKGYPRCARDDEIAVVNNFYLDFDFIDSDNDNGHPKKFKALLEEMDAYLSEKGIHSPARAFSGNGYHLLFPLPAVTVKEHEDIGDRLNAFLKEVHGKFSSDMDSIGIRLDNTTDLARIAKIYGTKKPGNASISRFYGGERAEDNVLLDYLLSLTVEHTQPARKPGGDKLPVKTYEKLPPGFLEMVEKDTELASLWSGTGKNSGDTSKSGYDMSLIHACIRRGITDVKALATILALREDGAVKGSGKGDEYIRLTVVKALQNSAW